MCVVFQLLLTLPFGQEADRRREAVLAAVLRLLWLLVQVGSSAAMDTLGSSGVLEVRNPCAQLLRYPVGLVRNLCSRYVYSSRTLSFHAPFLVARWKGCWSG
jgi:hypothetical protein